jgi:predicted lipoprotein with Yx(FWY)xxD motif
MSKRAKRTFGAKPTGPHDRGLGFGVGFRTLRVLGAVFALATSVAGASAAGTSLGTVASTRNSALGEILVNSAGRTIYHSSAEPRGRIACVRTCAVKWPPLVISASVKPVAGPGVKSSLLGTITRPDGRRQVTYRGLALYLFGGDAKAGQVNGQGIGGTWHAITPAGVAAAKAAGGSVASGTSDQMSGSGSSTVPSSGTGGANPAMWCAANPNSCVNGVPVTGGR